MFQNRKWKFQLSDFEMNNLRVYHGIDSTQAQVILTLRMSKYVFEFCKRKLNIAKYNFRPFFFM